jgi:putative acetyltransferase
MHIRDERPEDAGSIRAVNLTAFETRVEADLVDALRDQATPIVSLVAEDAEAIVGHIFFSPVTLAERPGLSLMGLAPMAVLPAKQRQGIGSHLVREGLERCRRAGAGAVVVVGHSTYYPRFGFVPASRFGLDCEYNVPDDVFLACELGDGALRGVAGTVRYHPAFANV